MGCQAWQSPRRPRPRRREEATAARTPLPHHHRRITDHLHPGLSQCRCAILNQHRVSTRDTDLLRNSAPHRDTLRKAARPAGSTIHHRILKVIREEGTRSRAAGEDILSSPNTLTKAVQQLLALKADGAVAAAVTIPALEAAVTILALEEATTPVPNIRITVIREDTGVAEKVCPRMIGNGSKYV